MIKTIVNWGWYPALITALAVAGLIYQWPIEAMAPTLIIILGIGLVVTIVRARDKQLELTLLRLRQLADYFNRRFMSSSSLSIFTIIDNLFGIDNPKLWDWARACGMSQRIFNTWCSSFVSRTEGDVRSRKLAAYLGTYLTELWSITNHYYEFIDQFYEIAEKMEVPAETIDQYNKFVMEYNAFVQDFRENISELRKVVKTGIEPPSVKLAQELPVVR
ncbi:hypothetical protein ACFLUZ_06250 [Chloroflexota bacterium]